MSILRRLAFSLWYYRRPPWESGIVPPEVEDFIRAHPPGRVLDLGCGTGTSSIALARAGWRVIGVDFARRAITIARAKAKVAGVSVDFRVDDVLRLHNVTDIFDLVLDIGCFHGLGIAERVAYLHNLDKLLAPEGTWLMYGFFKPDARPGPGLLPADIELAELHLNLIERKDGMDKKGRPSAWFTFQKDDGRQTTDSG